jgi:hypothetical protein
VRNDGTELNGCTAVPYLCGSGERLSRYEKTVDSRFLVSLVNAPSSGTAFIEFKCPGVSSPVRSREFSLAEASEPNGIDIGLVLVSK